MRGWYWLGMIVIALGVTLMEVLVGESHTDTPSQDDKAPDIHAGRGS